MIDQHGGNCGKVNRNVQVSDLDVALEHRYVMVT